MIITLTGIPAEGGAHSQQISQCGSPLPHGLVPTSIWAGLYTLQPLLWFTGKRPLMCHSQAEWMRQKWHPSTWITERKLTVTEHKLYPTSARGRFCFPTCSSELSFCTTLPEDTKEWGPNQKHTLRMRSFEEQSISPNVKTTHLCNFI